MAREPPSGVRTSETLPPPVVPEDASAAVLECAPIAAVIVPVQPVSRWKAASQASSNVIKSPQTESSPHRVWDALRLVQTLQQSPNFCPGTKPTHWGLREVGQGRV